MVSSTMTNSVPIKIPQGRVEGIVQNSREGKDFNAFYGIPYAKKPQRFQPPEKWEPWTGTLNGTKPKERCPQSSLITQRVFGNEDCLYLNVFTPSKLPIYPEESGCSVPQKRDGVPLLPVMVFIYGGGYYVGGGDLYGGKYLVDQGVILVTFNYRLGALGFLNSGDGQVRGNMGMKDQVMALKWIQENISYFGGDKDKVTIFGESAGAACVHLHLMSEMSKGLFHQAIMQSGNAYSPWAFTRNPEEKVRQLVKQLGLNCDLNDMKGMIEALKGVHPYALATQRMNYDDWNTPQPPEQIWFAPSIESGDCSEDNPSFINEDPIDIIKAGRFVSDVPLIMGINGREGAYRAIPILQDPKKLKALNENWAEVAPTYIRYDPEKFPDNEGFVRDVRSFYFGDKEVTWNMRDRVIDLFSDRWFNHSTRKAAVHHIKAKREDEDIPPVYLYLFDYEGEFSYCRSFLVFETYGAAHADELQYLMEQHIFYSRINKGSRDDWMIGKMSEMWGNFAKTGVPKHSGSDCGWEPLKKDELDDGLKYYRISMKDATIKEPFTARMEFWDKHEDNLIS